MHTSQSQHSRDPRHGERCTSNECLPLVIGVTGHRDYDPRYKKELQIAINRILQDVLKEYGNTEIILLSPLAPGADRLAAAVALDLGISLYVPLPFPRNDLPPGFVMNEEHADFEKLCRAAKHLFFVGRPGTPGVPLALPSHSEKKSDTETEAQYAAAGAFVAAHCHILIALWDGNGNSQTARTLGYKRTGLPQKFAPGRSLLDPVDGGIWHHVYTPRINSAPSHIVPPPKPGDIVPPPDRSRSVPRQPNEKIGSSARRKIDDCKPHEDIDLPLFRNIDDYNRYVKNLLARADAAAKLDVSRNSLFRNDDKIRLSPALKRLRDSFAAADVLAMELKARAHRNFWTLVVLVIAASTIFLLQAEFPFFQDKPGLLVVTALLLAGVQLLLRVWRRPHDRYQDKFQDYRALAEGLRVQFYWTLLGLPDSVSDHYLTKQRLELEWVRHVFSTWDIYKGGGEDAHHDMTVAQRRLRITTVQKDWVDAQQSFFSSKRSQDSSVSQRAELSGKNLLNLYIGLMVTFGVLLWLAKVFLPLGLGYERLHSFCIFLIEVPLIVAAVVNLKAEKLALTAQAKQYERMDRLFSDAKTHLGRYVQGITSDGLSTDTEVDDLLRCLGREALAENADWVLMHRERLLEISYIS